MKKAIAFARVSSAGQATEDKASHAEQLRDIRTFAEREGYKIVEEVREVASGNADLTGVWRDVRPLLADAWDKLENGQVSALVFWDPSRFCRDEEMMGTGSTYFVLKSRRYADGIRFVHGEADPESEMSALLTMVQALGPALEWKAQQRRFNAAKERMFENGELGEGDWPFGYNWNRKEKEFEVVEEQAEIVRLMFKLYAGGNLTLRALVKQLEGHPTATGNYRWNPAVIGDMLRRECYSTGLHQHRYGDRIYELAVPIIVDQGEWNQVQRLLSSRRNNSGPRRGSQRMLSGRIFCGSCKDDQGHPLAYYCGSGYMCRARRDGGGCTNPYVGRVRAERLVWDAVVKVLTDRRSFTKAAEKRLSELHVEIAKLSASMPDLASQITQVAKEQARAEEMFIATGSERSKARAIELVKKMKTLREQKRDAAEEEEALRQLQADAAWLQESVRQGTVTISRLADLPDGQVEVWQDSAVMIDESKTLTSWDTEIMSKRRLIELLDLRVIVHSDRMEITGVVEAAVPLSRPAARR